MSDWVDVDTASTGATSSNDWIDVTDSSRPPSDNKLSLLDSIREGVVSAANSATFGFGDEAAAGVRSLLPGFASYDEELAAIRGGQKQFATEHPYIDLGTKVAGALAMPVGGLAAKGATFGSKAALAAAEGAGLGGLYGFGEGEGGLENRAENALRTGAIASVLSPLVAVAPSVFRKSGDDFERAALNIGKAELKKSAKFTKTSSTDEVPLVKALEGVRERGLFKGSKDANAMIERNEGLIGSIGDDVTSILKKADAKQTDVTIPSFDNTARFIAEHPFEKDILIKQRDSRLDTINNLWDGSVSGLNKIKQYLHKIAYKNTTDSKELDKALATDIRRSIESQADNLLGGDAGSKIKALNEMQGEHLTLRDVLFKNKIKDEEVGGAAKLLRRTIVSPAGGGVAGLGISMATGNPVPALLGLAGGAMLTKPGQFALSGLSRSAESGAEAASPILQALISRGPAAAFSPEEAAATALEPMSTWQDIGSEQQASPINDNLLDAIKQVESGGVPKGQKAISPKGAQGPYQFMPATAKAYGLKDPFDEVAARTAANSLLTDELEALESLPLAVASYNAGRPKILNAIKKAGSADWEDVSEFLPKETQNYVEKVFRLLS